MMDNKHDKQGSYRVCSKTISSMGNKTTTGGDAGCSDALSKDGGEPHGGDT